MCSSDLNKGATLFLLDIELDKVRLLFRLAHDLRLLPTDKYGQVSERLVEIGRLLGGWQRSLKAIYTGRLLPIHKQGDWRECPSPITLRSGFQDGLRRRFVFAHLAVGHESVTC